MPTVLLLDVSLSMSRPVDMPDCTQEYQRRHLAIHGINTILDFCAEFSKLEFISLVAFSSAWEQLSGFTREYGTIKSALNKIGDYDKTCIEAGLSGVASTVTAEWGNGTLTQVILITDGNSGVGLGSLQHSLNTMKDRSTTDDKFPLPFAFPCKLHVICLTPPEEKALQHSMPLYQRMIDLGSSAGEVFVPDGQLTLKSAQHMFTQLAERHLRPFTGTLKCGNLKCNVHVHPAPDLYDKKHDFGRVKVKMNETMEICGFLDIGDIASPAALSRHLVLAISNTPEKEKPVTEGEDSEESEDGKMAAFTLLLHGSLKVEGMVALTQVADEWFGMIYSWADKKKSNLMLSLFHPGKTPIAWLGDLTQLAPLSDFAESPYGDTESKSPFPVRPADRRSYAQNCVVWIKPSGIQADVQKILRHARKLPEKQQHFYKELNRIRRAALSFGFLELLESLSAMLERECTLLPGTAHPDAALQLTHAAKTLRSPRAQDIAQPIIPLRTNFTGD